MKSQAWWLLLLPIVFGIGWTTHVLAEGVGSEAPGRENRDHSRSHFFHRKHGGPFAKTVAEFAADLGFSEEQQARLDAILVRTEREVEQHEDEIRDIYDQARSEIHALLTSEQTERMVEMIQSGIEEYREEKLERTLGWLRENTRLNEDGLVKAAEIVREYGRLRSTLMLAAVRSGNWPDREQTEHQVREWRGQRDAGIRELLSADEYQRYEQEHCSHRRDRCHDDEAHSGDEP